MKTILGKNRIEHLCCVIRTRIGRTELAVVPGAADAAELCTSASQRRRKIKEISKQVNAPLFHRVVGIASYLIPMSFRRRIYDTPLLAPLIRLVLTRTAPGGRCCVTVTGGLLKGAKMMVNLRCEKFMWLGTHEVAVQKLVEQHVKPGMVVFDIGSHIGFFALAFSRLVGEAGEVYAFEPYPPNYDALTQNIRLNALENVLPQKLAVSRATGTLEFYPNEKSPSTGMIGAVAAKSSGAIHVDAVSVDDFAFRSGNRAPDFMKIDVEGAAGEVLRGMVKVAGEKQPRILIEIHHAAEQADVREALSQLSYRSELVRDPEQKPGGESPEFIHHVLAMPC